MTSEQDRGHLARAIELASNGLYTTDPNPRVGCVIVKDNRVIGEGWHERTGGAHAEVMALEQAGNSAAGSTVYISLEPCSHHGRTPPCTDALTRAKVSKVFVAGLDPNPQVAGKGIEKLKQSRITVTQGLLQQEAEQLNPGFIKRMRYNLPFVRCKIAMSMDGRTAMASGESQWITGEDARHDVHRYRARSSAILVGIGTVLADDPSLNVRLPQSDATNVTKGTNVSPSTNFTDADQPIRVIVDTQLRTPLNAKLLSLPGRTFIYTLSSDRQRMDALSEAGAEIIMAERLIGEDQSSQVKLEAVLRDLAIREINEVMVEAGSHINGSLLNAGLVDELIFYQAPVLMGDQAKAAFHLPKITEMSQKIELEVLDARQIGVDWRIIAHLKNRKLAAEHN